MKRYNPFSWGKPALLAVCFSVCFSTALIPLQAQTPPTQSSIMAPIPPGVSSLSARAATSGSISYYYWVVARFTAGYVYPANAAYAQGFTSSAPAVSNTMTISWTPIVNATGYDVLRNTSSQFPANPSCTCAVVLNTPLTSVVDNGSALSAFPAPGVGFLQASTGNFWLDNYSTTTPQLWFQVPGYSAVNLSAAGSGTPLTFSGPLSLTGTNVDIPVATSGQSGYLATADYINFLAAYTATNAAVSTNTASRLVMRDALGGFAAGIGTFTQLITNTVATGAMTLFDSTGLFGITFTPLTTPTVNVNANVRAATSDMTLVDTAFAGAAIDFSLATNTKLNRIDTITNIPTCDTANFGASFTPVNAIYQQAVQPVLTCVGTSWYADMYWLVPPTAPGQIPLTTTNQGITFVPQNITVTPKMLSQFGNATVTTSTSWVDYGQTFATNLGGAQVPVNTEQIFGIGGTITGVTMALEINRRIEMRRPGTLSNLSIATSSTQPVGNSLVLTIRVNGTDTAITCTVAAGAVAGFCRDTVNSVIVAVGDMVSLHADNNDLVSVGAGMTSVSFLVR